ncbi:hypothetical protein C479_04127 [Halovivax asiaticus JCM 14624]|uniref:SHOCT domain-containing protein n=1 Tax=Halovivax asiaticus JCM 14624 TaxID=1227490 RepID=M0BR27_9EURY|nr:SHOCT domain-containing protein [Halovivax asiaticus]ELZ12552.1 hypothetical protein C479_04127 [Halovivax asiaticus JCM 14624]
MGERLREFVADDCWLLIGVVTFALVSLAGVAGFSTLAGVVSIVGWFLLTPIFLFWGDEIASLFDDRGVSDSHSSESDAYEELKRRYAAGEIDEDEFERRLDRLVAADDSFDGPDWGTESPSATNEPGGSITADHPPAVADEVDERDRTREFEQ